YHRKRPQPVLQELGYSEPVFGWYVPDCVQRLLQFVEDSRGAEQQSKAACDCGQYSGGWRAAGLYNGLNELGRFPSDIQFELIYDAALHRIIAEENADKRNEDDQQRCE